LWGKDGTGIGAYSAKCDLRDSLLAAATRNKIISYQIGRNWING